MRLDILIAKLESASPGPRLATVEAWLVHLQTKRDNMLGVESTVNQFENQQSVQISSQYRGEIEILSPTSQQQQLLQPVSQPIGNGIGVQEGGLITRLPNDILANTPTKDLSNVSS